MSRRVNGAVRSLAAALWLLLGAIVSPAAAQTTLVLETPETEEVTDSFVRGGTYANTVYNTDALATKANTNLSYVRRSFLKFDTSRTMPAGVTIQSATLQLTLKKTDPETRTLGVYHIKQAFQESQATWYTRQAGYKWTTAGGSIGAMYAQAAVGTSVGSQVTVDVTRLVQAAVNGSLGSRYTRIALIDIGQPSNTSYKEFHSSEAADPSTRPRLTVVYGGAAEAPEPPPPSTGSTLRVLDWNIHRGWGTDGKYNLQRIADWIVKVKPDVVSLNEVQYFTSYANVDQPAQLHDMLRKQTGTTWYRYFRTSNGATKGPGNLILSRFPIVTTSYCRLSSIRNAVQATVVVNGRNINFFSTHLDSADSSTQRIIETKVLLPCVAGLPQQRIVAGDFNSQATKTEIQMVAVDYYDAWAKAKASGQAIAFPGNDGQTRNTRIDYVFYSKQAGALVLKQAQVFDTRDAYGRMPSDHRPLMAVFEVR